MADYDDNKSWLKIERDNLIRTIHKRIINESGINKHYLTRSVVAQQIQKYSAPRFYIDTRRCRELVNGYNAGTLKCSALTQAMARDLAECYEEVCNAYPNKPMEDKWQLTVEHPAKSFYLSKLRIIEIVYQYHDRKAIKKLAQ